MFTTNRRDSATAAAVRTVLLMQASIIGGSADREVTELAVIPNFFPSTSVVRIVTPLARCPTTWRNCSASTGGALPVAALSIPASVAVGRIGRPTDSPFEKTTSGRVPATSARSSRVAATRQDEGHPAPDGHPSALTADGIWARGSDGLRHYAAVAARLDCVRAEDSGGRARVVGAE